MQINHVVLNTGKTSRFQKEDIDSAYTFVFNRVYKNSFNPTGIVVLEKYRVKSERYADGILLTINGDNNAPLATVAISNSNRNNLWRLLHESSHCKLVTDVNKPCKAPYVSVRLDIGIILDIESLHWIGGFIIHFAWFHFNPVGKMLMHNIV